MHQDSCPSFQDVVNVREERWRKRLQRLVELSRGDRERQRGGPQPDQAKLFVLAVFRTPFLNNMKVNLEDNMDVIW